MPSDDWTRGLGWSDFAERQFADLGRENDALLNDRDLQNAYELGWFNQDIDTDYRIAAREFAVEWLRNEYGVEFDEIFDWDDWRERYAGG